MLVSYRPLAAGCAEHAMRGEKSVSRRLADATA